MKKKVYSVLVIIVFSVCMFLFSSLYQSSLSFEDLRVIVNDQDNETSVSLELVKPSEQESYFYDTYIQNPATLELYLRASMINSKKNNTEKTLFYKRLLKTRPSWPYYFSGLAQVNHMSGQFDSNIINSIIHYGKYERKVVLSLAEILFHNWERIENKYRELILSHISEQQDYIISQTVNISSKFAKIYEYCDFIYEKKHVEYAACKQNYWQPLSD